MKESTQVVVALIAALVLGGVIAATGNRQLLRATDFVAPLGVLWVNGIRMTVVPLIVALLVSGVASVADLRVIGRMGGRTLLVFILLIAGTAAFVIPAAAVVFAFAPSWVTQTQSALPAGAVEAAGQLAAAKETVGFSTWVTSLLPTNPVAAAANGAMLPLIVFTLLFALAVARSQSGSRETLLGFFRAVAEAMLVLVRWVVLLAPIGVFALLLPLGAHGGFAVAGAFGFYVVVYSLGSVVVTALLYPVVALVSGIPVRRFARALLPGQSIAFSSSSSLASLPALVEGAEDVLELPERVTGFVLPLAVSLFKIAGPVTWTFGALFIARFYGISLGAPQLATIAFAAIFLAFGVPGVPRGGFLMLTPLFLAIGLPAEGIGILIAIDAIPDLFATVLNTTGYLAATVLVARGEMSDAPAPLQA
jgi:Na+/H+-dicarboxylate symporter